jgi:predicted adenine nucleotide alpha hydrolase (AANH) superfamily ATPase
MFEDTIASLGGRTPSLLLHACCAPCLSSVLERLGEHFSVTVLYYNPNIFPPDEYEKRLSEIQKLLGLLETGNTVKLLCGEYNPGNYRNLTGGMEKEPEGGTRCRLCFELRLGETARLAREGGFDYFTTTLTVSPHKNAALLNAIGGAMSEKYGVPYLFSDFKKRDGYKRSIELSNTYGLYRQNYCGCEFSKRA